MIFTPADIEMVHFTADDAGNGQAGFTGSIEITGDDRFKGRAFRDQQPGRQTRLLAAEISEGRIGLALPTPQGIPFTLTVTEHQNPGHARNIYRVIS
jgi:hypothetical protein